MSNNVSLGSKISKLRQQVGLSQSILAEYLGVDQSYISRVEKDQRQLNLSQLSELASLFGCTLDQLESSDDFTGNSIMMFRAEGLHLEDLKVISRVNRIVNHMTFLNGLERNIK